jgi:hypothetical protein
VCEKISRKKIDFSVLSVVISHAKKLMNVGSKFQVFISYSFCVIIFFYDIMKEGAVDPLNGWHVNAPGYLNSWQ